MLQMSPRDIRFTHDTIKAEFRNGYSLLETFIGVLYGTISVDALPKLHVVWYNNNYFVVSGNRRLCILQNLEEAGKIKQIKVIVKKLVAHLFCKMYTTKNHGKLITVRRHPHLLSDMKLIGLKWRKENIMSGVRTPTTLRRAGSKRSHYSPKNPAKKTAATTRGSNHKRKESSTLSTSTHKRKQHNAELLSPNFSYNASRENTAYTPHSIIQFENIDSTGKSVASAYRPSLEAVATPRESYRHREVEEISSLPKTQGRGQQHSQELLSHNFSYNAKSDHSGFSRDNHAYSTDSITSFENINLWKKEVALDNNSSFETVATPTISYKSCEVNESYLLPKTQTRRQCSQDFLHHNYSFNENQSDSNFRRDNYACTTDSVINLENIDLRRKEISSANKPSNEDVPEPSVSHAVTGSHSSRRHDDHVINLSTGREHNNLSFADGETLECCCSRCCVVWIIVSVVVILVLTVIVPVAIHLTRDT